jgi:cell division protein FtsQ
MAQGRKRKRRRATFYTPIAIVLIVFAVFFGISVFFRVTDIQIVGAERYTAEQILSASRVSRGDNLLLLDPAEVIENITSRLPYISDVVVEKHIPDKITVTVTESRPVAAIEAAGQWWLLDQKGRALEKADRSALSGKVRVDGLNPDNVVAGQALVVTQKDVKKREALSRLLLALHHEEMLDQCEWIDVSNIAGITMRYGGRFTVVLGTADDVEKNLLRLVGVVEQLDEGDVGRIDMTNDAEARFIPDS